MDRCGGAVMMSSSATTQVRLSHSVLSQQQMRIDLPSHAPGKPPSVISNTSGGATMLPGVPGSVSTSLPVAATSTDGKVMVINEAPSYFIHKISEQERREGMAAIDHGYSRPWNWRPDGLHTRPTKTLFVPKMDRALSNTLANGVHQNAATIDVDNIEDESSLPPLHYDEAKSNKIMGECERFSEFANPEALSEDEMDDWEEHIVKDGWIPRQNKLFLEIMKMSLSKDNNKKEYDNFDI